MPRIKTVERQVASVGVGGGPRASSQVFGGGIGEGMESIGRAVENTSQALITHKENNDAYKADIEAKKYQQQVLTAMQEKKNSLTDDQAEGFAETSYKELEEQRQSLVDKFEGSQKAKSRLNNSLQQINFSQERDLRSFEVQAVSRKKVNDFKQVHDQDLNIVFGDYSKTRELLDGSLALINNMEVDGKVKSQLTEMAKSEYHSAGLNGFVNTVLSDTATTSADIENAVKALQSDKNMFKVNADPKDYQRAIKSLQAGVKQHKARENFQYVNAFNDWALKAQSTGVDEGGFTEEEIRSVVEDPKDQERLIRKSQVVRKYATAMNEVRESDKSLAEIGAEIASKKEGLKSVSADNFEAEMSGVQAMQGAFEQVVRQYKADPANYVIGRSEAVSAAYTEFQKNPTIKTLETYADATISEQMRIDPNSPPSLLTSQEADSVRASMDQINIADQGGKVALDNIQSLEQKWGRHFPAVVRDLKKNKALNGSQYVAATMADQPALRGLAEDVMEASVLKTEHFRKELGAAEYKDIEDSTRAALQDFRGSLKTLANREQVVADYQDAIARTVAYKQLSGEDVDADQIASQIINDRYVFEDGLRIPVANDSPPMRAGMRKLKNRIDTLDLANIPVALSGLREEDSADLYRESIRNDGTFVTAGDDSGVELIDGTGNVVMIKDDKGKPIRAKWKWSELEDIGSDPSEFKGITGEDFSRGLSF